MNPIPLGYFAPRLACAVSVLLILGTLTQRLERVLVPPSKSTTAPRTVKVRRMPIPALPPPAVLHPPVRQPSVTDQAEPRAVESHKVLKVVDGDTVVINLEGRETTVRLIGVDAPEGNKSDGYGREASQFVENLLRGESVFIEYEAEQARVDRYGRTLAYLYRSPDRLFVNLEIVRQGFGRVHLKYPFRRLGPFRQFEEAAKQLGKGLWAGEEAREVSRSYGSFLGLGRAIKVERRFDF